jgi:hypothetical protein
MKTLDAATVLTEITDHAANIREGREQIKPGDPYAFTGANSPGDRAWQGDLCVTLVSHTAAAIKSPVKCGAALVPDNGTQGSRHTLDSLEGVVFSRGLPATKESLEGPAFTATEPRSILHPVHGRIDLCPGTWDIGYQRELDKDQRAERRARD